VLTSIIFLEHRRSASSASGSWHKFNICTWWRESAWVAASWWQPHLWSPVGAGETDKAGRSGTCTSHVTVAGTVRNW